MASAGFPALQWMDGYRPRQPGVKLRSKVHHSKSKTGCERCRKRRVKCNETKPSCSDCSRKGLPCIYAWSSPRGDAPGLHGVGNNTFGRLMFLSGFDSIPKSLILPESSQRLSTELCLFHQYVAHTGPPLVLNGPCKTVWNTMIPEFSLHSEALRFAMYALAAMHRSKQYIEGNPDKANLRSFYLDIALRESKRELAQMNRTNIDSICATAQLHRLCAFFMLQGRSRHPYTAPIDWLRVTKSTAEVFARAVQILGLDGSSATATLINSTAVIIESCIEARDGTLHSLLLPSENQGRVEAWDSNVQSAYTSAIDYINGLMRAIEVDNITSSEVCRRLVVFPVLVDGRFVKLVEEQRPRAMVILAYYFGLLSRYGRNVWYIGDAGLREFRAIQSFLAPAWQPLLATPSQWVNESN